MIATSRRAFQPSRRPAAPVFRPSDEIRAVARQVLRLDLAGRWTPESALLAKDALAERLFALAGRLEA